MATLPAAATRTSASESRSSRTNAGTNSRLYTAYGECPACSEAMIDSHIFGCRPLLRKQSTYQSKQSERENHT